MEQLVLGMLFFYFWVIIYNIQIRNLRGETVYLNCTKVPSINYTAIFLIRPDIQNDIYHLFLNNH